MNITIKADTQVVLRNGKQGIVRFIGEGDSKKEELYGIELQSPVGNTDGWLDDKYNFRCQENFGVYVNRQQITFPSFIVLSPETDHFFHVNFAMFMPNLESSDVRNLCKIDKFVETFQDKLLQIYPSYTDTMKAMNPQSATNVDKVYDDDGDDDGEQFSGFHFVKWEIDNLTVYDDYDDTRIYNALQLAFPLLCDQNFFNSKFLKAFSKSIKVKIRKKMRKRFNKKTDLKLVQFEHYQGDEIKYSNILKIIASIQSVDASVRSVLEKNNLDDCFGVFKLYFKHMFVIQYKRLGVESFKSNLDEDSDVFVIAWNSPIDVVIMTHL